MTVAALQMTSGTDAGTNVATARRLLAEAAASGARVAVLPENFALMARDATERRAIAETHGDGPIQTAMSTAARELGLWVIAGTLPLRLPGEPRFAQALLVYDDTGREVARYDKIHLFDVDVPGAGESHRESASMCPGQKVVSVDTPVGRVGLAICYDLRFPELFRALTEGGATTFVVTSGWPASRIEHWNVLTQARAIENQAWVIACNEVGAQPGIELGGHSCVIDPKGKVVARGGGNEEIIYVEVDPELPEKWRESFPALKDIRLR